MTKQHFIRAAEIVRAINDGDWTHEAPDWANFNDYYPAAIMEHYTRAVQTAEVFIMLFSEHNPRFDYQRFLVACGLAVAPAKVKKGRAK